MYFNELQENNITYSVDKIRLKTYIPYTFFTEIEFRFDTCYRDFVKKKWTSPKLSNFFYNYDIEIEEGKSFWFGFMHNTEKRTTNELSKYNFTIEFNPNKLKDERIIFYILSISHDWYLVSYDLAFDIKVNIVDVIFDPYRKRSIKIFSNGFDDKTIMIGKGNGRIKIYNKKRESDLHIPYDLTRVEVSRVVTDFPITDITKLHFGIEFLPQIFLNQYLYTFSDYKDKTLFAILFAVQNGFPVNDLSRVYKKKIKEMFQGGCKVHFNEILATQVVRKTILYYFLKDEKIKFH